MKVTDLMPFTVPQFVAPFEADGFFERAREEADRMRTRVRNVFQKTGHMPLTYFVFATNTPGGACVLHVEMKDPGPNDYQGREKELLADFIGYLAKESEAVAVCMCAETWINGTPEGVDPKVHEAELERWRKAHDDSIEGHPNTTEHLLTIFECARFTQLARAAIQSRGLDPVTGKEARTVAPWVVDPHTRLQGRFVNVLARYAGKAS